jgi:adenylylsulfate reductase subunit A
MAEAAIAASSALEALHAGPRPARDAAHDAQPLLCELRRFFDGEKALFTARDLEDAMQRTMDEYAGGIGADYAFSSVHLDKADARIGELSEMCGRLRAADMRELLRICELRERLVVCRSVIAHLRARRETRWPGFGRNLDYPRKDAAWQCCVNSKLENGKLRIILRELSNGEVRA